MNLIYSISIHLFYLLMFPVALFNRKARLWISGRKNWQEKLKEWQHGKVPVFWFHAASLGEFEQGRPVMEEIKRQNPDCKLLLTFYSPSGYEIRKNYQEADFICYLPLDTKYNAQAFIDIVKPDAVFFIKYEFWHFYLHRLHLLHIPVYLISGIFRPHQVFFRWYGLWFRKQLKYFNHFFLQDKVSAELLGSIDMNNISVTGDTRFDRVMTIASEAKNIDIARAFSSGNICIVAGSTWPSDEQLLAGYINSCRPDVRFIIAPHEINQAQIFNLIRLIKGNCILFSEATINNVSGMQVLIIDNIGMLSSLYACGRIAYIGGGFGKGIHNILEAAVYGIPVVFGPNHAKFREAGELISAGGAFSIHNGNEMKRTMDRLTGDSPYRAVASDAAKAYILNNTGATSFIIEKLKTDLQFVNTLVEV